MIRLIRAATLARLHRRIEFLERDLAHSVISRELVQQTLEKRDTEFRSLTKQNDRAWELIHALLFGEETDEQPTQTVTIQ